jgi:uncharacterized protein YndB with AHSA1/START domain
VAEPGLSITRVFDAPRERVWREWTTPERFADWFGGEAEVPPDSVSMDVRKGGRTELRLEQTGHLSAAQYRRARDGWGSFLDRIAARLAAGPG